MYMRNEDIQHGQFEQLWEALCKQRPDPGKIYVLTRISERHDADFILMAGEPL